MENSIELVITIMLILNVVLSSSAKILDILKKPLSEDHFVYKALNLIQKAIDFISANISHKK